MKSRIRFHVWNHTEDRRTPQLRTRGNCLAERQEETRRTLAMRALSKLGKVLRFPRGGAK